MRRNVDKRNGLPNPSMNENYLSCGELKAVLNLEYISQSGG